MKIAVVGRIRSGKDTFAEYFLAKGFKKAAFGDGIRSVLEVYFPEALETGKPRKHYQVVGQAFRQLDPDVWVKLLDSRLNVIEDIYKQSNIIVPDLRQANEYEALKKKGFTFVKVEATEQVRISRMRSLGDCFSTADLQHETEEQTDFIPYDYLVTNNGSVQELEQQAAYIYEEMRKENGRC